MLRIRKTERIDSFLDELFNKDVCALNIKIFGSLRYAITSIRTRPEPRVSDRIFDRLVEHTIFDPDQQVNE